MKTTIDIPENELMDAIKFTGAHTKRDAVVAALEDFNRRQRMAAIAKHLGTCSEMMTPEELVKLRGTE
jgi:Arc/MetJ family transcription regulator